MENSELYSGLYLAKNKVEDILYLEVCSRYGAPSVDKTVFADWKMEPEYAHKLGRVLAYLRSQSREQFLVSLLTK